MKTPQKVKPIAFVLPQFHPIPENDEWWGEGFTEWTNVKKAKPLFKRHYQPHKPTSNLGYYDLRLPEVRKSQAQLAKKFGIEGFCYYHYWFNGKRLLDQPIDGMLNQKDLDMPFMLCWANENWTRRWDGLENEILIKQDYSKEDDIAHMVWLCNNVFNDERYITVNGCPVFMVYKQDLFPDIKETAKVWRSIAQKNGFKNLYLCVVESYEKTVNPEVIGFDACIEFSPHGVMRYRLERSKWESFKDKFQGKDFNNLNINDFKKGALSLMNKETPNYKYFRSVTPSWDNTPRLGDKGYVGFGSSPKLFGKWIREIVNRFIPYSKDENFLFINAMNEWAEGNHLEPCEKYGVSFLNELKKNL